MVEPAVADAVFHALAHEVRRGMLTTLTAGDRSVGELAEPLSMTFAAASKHVQVLERAGLVRRTVTGRRHVLQLVPGPLASVSEWLRFYEGFWTERLDALEAVLTERRDMSPTVRLERTLSAAPATVYRAWLEPDTLRRWLGPGDYSCARAEVDAQVGGRYRIWHVDTDGTDVGGAEGVFTELVADERIALRWHFVFTDRTTPAAEESLLTISLAPGSAPGTTQLTLVHDRLDGLHAAHPEIVDNIEGGWTSVLDQLTTTLEA